eukprot:6795058-Pyramimonas_sp.AAC.1
MAPSGALRALISLAWASSSCAFIKKLRPRMKPRCAGAPMSLATLDNPALTTPATILLLEFLEADGA